MSRNKGHRFERFLASVLLPFIPDARRGNQSHNPRECDVEGSPHLRIEAKHVEKVGYEMMRKWIAKAHVDAEKFKDGRIPIIIMKRNREEPLFVGALSSLMRIHELLYGDQREDAEVIDLRGEDE